MRDPEDGAVVGVFGDAFRLRDGEDFLSALWPEYYSGTPSEQNAKAIMEFSASVTVKPKDRFVRGNVGAIKAACAAQGDSIRITSEPETNLACHAAVRRYNDQKPELLEALAREAWADLI